MKAEIHPEYYPVIFVDGEHEFITKSTIKSGKTRDIEGVEHYVLDVAISSATHPYWTGTQRMLDTAGRVERFNRKYGRKSQQEVAPVAAAPVATPEAAPVATPEAAPVATADATPDKTQD